MLKAAHARKGAAFIEIFQNCIVYNKDVFEDFAAPKGAEDRQLWLKQGEPMLLRKGHQGHRARRSRRCTSRPSMSSMATGGRGRDRP